MLIYLQIDGQPVDGYHWDQKTPYTPTLKEKVGNKWQMIPWEGLTGKIDRDWRIFARSSSDAKGPVAMFLAALDAHADLELPLLYNMKVIMDFEEELGSPHLPGAVSTYKEALAADMFIIYDGPAAQYKPANPELWRTRHIHHDLNCLWPASAATQWSFWELCAESCCPPISTDCVYEGRGRARPRFRDFMMA